MLSTRIFAHKPPRLFFHDFCYASTCSENVSSRLESKLGVHTGTVFTISPNLIEQYNASCSTVIIRNLYKNSPVIFMLNRFFRFRAEILHSKSITSASILSALSRHKSKRKSVQGAAALSSLNFKEEMGTSIRLYGGSNSSMSAHVSIQAGLNFGDQQMFYNGFAPNSLR